jgi:hypothetical protein
MTNDSKSNSHLQIYIFKTKFGDKRAEASNLFSDEQTLDYLAADYEPLIIHGSTYKRNPFIPTELLD